jgi:membrane-associated PAP2 superfamily phosphatase
VAIVLLAAAAILANRSGADIAVESLFFDAAAMRFPWRDHPLLALVLHDAAKWLSTVVAIGLLVALAVASRRPRRLLSDYRNAHSCPWDLALFGGQFDFYPLFGARPPKAGPGRCLPSGHASVGWMWIAVAFAWRRLPRSTALRKHALAIGGSIAVFALATSAAQVLRGAHFLSHVAWTAVICWTVAYASDRLMPRST